MQHRKIRGKTNLRQLPKKSLHHLAYAFTIKTIRVCFNFKTHIQHRKIQEKTNLNQPPKKAHLSSNEDKPPYLPLRCHNVTLHANGSQFLVHIAKYQAGTTRCMCNT
jgi:hypothetical protein